ncbi:hypothetical protein imdm_816 [gamma proteobacterium IMCC2047]|nr:hypothetical protein imdm_816 [gamma proteobacterium IMCC2047]
MSQQLGWIFFSAAFCEPQQLGSTGLLLQQLLSALLSLLQLPDFGF